MIDDRGCNPAAKKTKQSKITKPVVKSLAALMKDEDGFVSKQNMLKVGLTTVAALSVVAVISDQSQAGLYRPPTQQGQITHTNTVTPNTEGTCAIHTNHSNYTY